VQSAVVRRPAVLVNTAVIPDLIRDDDQAWAGIRKYLSRLVFRTEHVNYPPVNQLNNLFRINFALDQPFGVQMRVILHSKRGVVRAFVIFALHLCWVAAGAVPAHAQHSVRHEMLLEEARKGDAEAQFSVGLAYASGFGVEADPETAVTWYRKAADQGLSIAQKNLAQLLAGGDHAQRNTVQAYKWYEISIPNLPDPLGRNLVRIERDLLAKNMTPDQIAEARKLAVAWIREFTDRTGRKLSQIDNYRNGEGGPAEEQGWTCDKKPVRSYDGTYPLNPCLLALKRGKWTEIHRQKKRHPFRFTLQSHGGSAFDTRRGRIVLFGSDTHDSLRTGNKELINSPLAFDVAKLRWFRFYPSDPLQTYAVNRSGIPVAGFAKNHPWAMHTYGAVEYDQRRDEIVVSSDPQHMEPGRFVNVVGHLWSRIKRHPTWVFSFKTNQWRALNTAPQSFFRFSTTYASDRGTVIGYRDDGVFELGGNIRRWRRISPRGLLGSHSNAVYDSKHKAVVVFGSGYDTGNSNNVAVFWMENRRHRLMPTPGVRPRPDAHVPLVYHPKLERTVALVDDDALSLTSRLRNNSRAQIWLYNLGKDQWTHVKSATMPLGLGMNYNMVYDPGHDLLLVVAVGEQRLTTVWALRL
jgi:hypothetical protein